MGVSEKREYMQYSAHSILVTDTVSCQFCCISIPSAIMCRMAGQTEVCICTADLLDMIKAFCIGKLFYWYKKPGT